MAAAHNAADMSTIEIEIVDGILATKKYRALYRMTVEHVVADCVRRVGPKRAPDEARSILHQIWGSYYPTRPDFKKLWEKFQAEAGKGNEQQAIEAVLRLHASSAERLRFLDDFYKKIFAVTGMPARVVDYGCGFNPLAYSIIASICHPEWSEGSAPVYHAFDIDVEEVDFLQKACTLLGYREVVVEAGDVLVDPPVAADVVFMLKLLPVLEQQQKGSAREVMLKQQARWLVVSYPVASLSGKEKGMADFYTQQFHSYIKGLDWGVATLLFPTELVFIVDTHN